MADRVLFSIDDDPQIPEIIREVALGLGYQVETALSAGQFVTAYVRAKSNVVTVDICMPETDGIELLRWLGDIGAMAKVIIPSGAHPSYGEMAQRLAQASGRIDASILRKPFRLAQLRQAASGEGATGAPGVIGRWAGASGAGILQRNPATVPGARAGR